MKVRYILRLVKNENKMINPKLGSYAYLFKPDAEDCPGWFASTRIEHSTDLFDSTWFKTKEEARNAACEHGAFGVTYQVIEVTVTDKVVTDKVFERHKPNP